MQEFIGPNNPQPATPPKEEYCGWAIAAIICAFLFPLLGIIFAIVALVKISHNHSLKGMGLAIAALIISALWSILVMFMAIGALAYFGALSPGNMLPQKCEFQAGLDCTEHPFATADSITFPIVNSMGFKMSIDAVSSPLCSGEGTTVNGMAMPVQISNGQPATIEMRGCRLKPGERFNEIVKISYTSNATGMIHTGTGTVAGKVGG
jgi:hypothetical protein